MGRKEKRRKAGDPLKLDLGCGQSKREGFLGVDKYAAPGVDRVADLLEFPWPFAYASVDEAHCSHFFEHVPGPVRGLFMNELWRILKEDAQATIIVPYYASMRAVQDYTHAWPPVAESSFLYFNREWREVNKLTHGAYDLQCNFDFTFGYNTDPSWGARPEEARVFGMRHYLNVAADLQVVLTKRA